jgi:hypothetical protein
MIKKISKTILSKIFAPILAEIDKPEYMKEIRRSYTAGYDYHQEAIKNDSELLQWVLRDDYMD